MQLKRFESHSYEDLADITFLQYISGFLLAKKPHNFICEINPAFSLL